MSAIMGCYAVQVGSWLPTFRGILWFSSLKVQQSKTNSSWNVWKYRRFLTLLNVLLRIYINCEYSAMVVMMFLCYHVKTSSFILEINILSDQKVSVHLTIAVHSTGTQRLFDRPVFRFTINVSFFFLLCGKCEVWILGNSGCFTDQGMGEC